jgi:hypothetical protein
MKLPDPEACPWASGEGNNKTWAAPGEVPVEIGALTGRLGNIDGIKTKVAMLI